MSPGGEFPGVVAGAMRPRLRMIAASAGGEICAESAGTEQVPAAA